METTFHSIPLTQEGGCCIQIDVTLTKEETQRLGRCFTVPGRWGVIGAAEFVVGELRRLLDLIPP
jgi:hypothetical protein